MPRPGDQQRLEQFTTMSPRLRGRQDLIAGKELTYGQSVTDGCIEWDSSQQVRAGLAAAVRQRGWRHAAAWVRPGS